jgi:hypothetical protein
VDRYAHAPCPESIICIRNTLEAVESRIRRAKTQGLIARNQHNVALKGIAGQADRLRGEDRFKAQQIESVNPAQSAIGSGSGLRVSGRADDDTPALPGLPDQAAQGTRVEDHIVVQPQVIVPVPLEGFGSRDSHGASPEAQSVRANDLAPRIGLAHGVSRAVGGAIIHDDGVNSGVGSRGSQSREAAQRKWAPIMTRDEGDNRRCWHGLFPQGGSVVSKVKKKADIKRRSFAFIIEYSLEQCSIARGIIVHKRVLDPRLSG